MVAPSVEAPHIPVLLEEIVEALAGGPHRVVADLTLGRGGHAEALLDRLPIEKYIAFDRDEDALVYCRERLARFGDRVQFVHASFSQSLEKLTEMGLAPIDALMADFGVSSPQLDEAERGFSFQRSGPLDMRMDRSSDETARDLIARLSEAELADVIFQYGDERASRPIARRLKKRVEEGELWTTLEARSVVVSVLGPQRRGGVDPATRTFQALRIAVNRELDEIETLLEKLPQILVENGRAALISFHSMEDRAVKHYLRESDVLHQLTKKPIVAKDQEIDINPRSRSAKLRVCEKVSEALD